VPTLTIENVSGFGETILVNVESNTSWRFVNITDGATFSRDYGFDYRDVYVTVEPCNIGAPGERIISAVIEYGSSYINKKHLVIKQALEYITINGNIEEV
jgi:hypothetical protein